MDVGCHGSRFHSPLTNVFTCPNKGLKLCRALNLLHIVLVEVFYIWRVHFLWLTVVSTVVVRLAISCQLFKVIGIWRAALVVEDLFLDLRRLKLLLGVRMVVILLDRFLCMLNIERRVVPNVVINVSYFNALNAFSSADVTLRVGSQGLLVHIW